MTDEEDDKMWIFSKYGFYSAVCARRGRGELGQKVDPERMMIRARDRAHLVTLQQRFPALLRGAKVRASVGTDYPFRMFVRKDLWAEVVLSLVAETDYDNFKAAEAVGPGYRRMLHDVWVAAGGTETQE